MKKEFLRAKIDTDKGPVEGYLDVDKIVYFRRNHTDPNWTIVFFEHRAVNVYMRIEDFCKAFEEMSYD